MYGNVAFSFLVLSPKNRYSIVLKKVFVFQKKYFKVEVLKTLKISSDYHIKKSISQTGGQYSPYSNRIRENKNHEKLQIWTILAHCVVKCCIWYNSISISSNYHTRGAFRTAATSKMEHSVTIVNSFQPLHTVYLICVMISSSINWLGLSFKCVLVTDKLYDL